MHQLLYVGLTLKIIHEVDLNYQVLKIYT